jgi:cytochrome c oxidase cbb3-type subunit 3
MMLLLVLASPAAAQSSAALRAEAAPALSTDDPLLRVSVSNLRPGAPPPARQPENPLANDPQAVTRGMRDFVLFNCVGCHAPNGGGGMGPALSEARYIYGGSPADLFLSIYQGRPNGMPAWGQTLPKSTVWELVAYVRSIGHPARKTLGLTISRTPQSPAVQQTPAEFLQTTHPWSFTESFSNGRKPNGE